MRTFTAPKSALNALSSIRRFHLDARYDVAGFDDVILGRWKRALPLTIRTIPRRAEAMPFRVLEQLCALALSLGPEGTTMASFLTLCFHSFARASSLLPRATGEYDASRLPTVADVKRRGEGFSLSIKWDKTHQAAWQAFQIPLLPRPASPACPVRAVQRLLQGAGHPRRFYPLVATPSHGGARGQGTPLTVGRARLWLRTLLLAAGLREDLYSLHSLRRGGCTLAYAGGAAVADLQSLGGWRSAAVHLYHSQTDARLRAAVALHNAPTNNP